MVLQEIGMGLAAGLVLGFFGYLSRDWTAEDGFEDFDLTKLMRTLVIYGAAGALVGYMGESITQGNIVAATGSTVVLGEIAERLIKGLQKHRSVPDRVSSPH